MTSIAIIGAGLSGLVLAGQLQNSARVTVFEKSRGVGGRMSTRYQDDYSFDHGAQYYTAKTPEFRAFLEPHIATGLVQEWHPRLVTIEHGTMPKELDDTKQFYTAVPRMTSLCKKLSAELDIRQQHEIGAIDRLETAWQLTTTNGKNAGAFDWIVSTAPALQSRRILPDNFRHRRELASTKMAACFTLMLGYARTSAIAWDAAKVVGSPIGWIAVNSTKPGRPIGHSLVVQTTNQWAEAHLESPKDEVTTGLLKDLTELTHQDFSGATYMSLHRWRYASTPSPTGASYLVDVDSQLAACGDWCIKGRVEAAFTSANSLANVLRQELT